MRSLFLPFSIWVGVLQLTPSHQQPTSLVTTATLLSAAVALSGLTVMVYRLGVWRQDIVNTKHNVGAEIARGREESTRQFEEVSRRLTAVEAGLRRLARQGAA